MRLAINVERAVDGYVCRAENGDLPFEGRKHASAREAMIALDYAYNGKTWQGRQETDTTYSIELG